MGKDSDNGSEDNVTLMLLRSIEKRLTAMEQQQLRQLSSARKEILELYKRFNTRTSISDKRYTELSFEIRSLKKYFFVGRIVMGTVAAIGVTFWWVVGNWHTLTDFLSNFTKSKS